MLEEALNSVLIGNAAVGALVGARVYPLVIPEEATLPAVAYQRVSGVRDTAHSDAQGFPGELGWAMGRVQLTINAETYSAAKSVARAIRKALNGKRGSMGGLMVHLARIENEQDGYNQTSKRCTVRLDVVVYYTET